MKNKIIVAWGQNEIVFGIAHLYKLTWLGWREMANLFHFGADAVRIKKGLVLLFRTSNGTKLQVLKIRVVTKKGWFYSWPFTDSQLIWCFPVSAGWTGLSSIVQDTQWNAYETGCPMCASAGPGGCEVRWAQRAAEKKCPVKQNWPAQNGGHRVHAAGVQQNLRGGHGTSFLHAHCQGVRRPIHHHV